MSNCTLGVVFETDSTYQWIVVPSANGPITWQRPIADRSRWNRETISGSEYFRAYRSGRAASFVVSEKMCREIVETGWSYSLPTTALRSLERVTGSAFGNHRYYEAVQNLDRWFLNEALINERRVNPVDVVPIEKVVGVKTAPAPAPVAAAPVVAAPVVAAPVVTPSVDDDQFNAILLPPSYADRYESRKIHGVDDFAIFDAALASHHNVLLGGDTGAGKTIAVKSWAASRGLRVAQVTGNPQNDAYRIMGKQILDNGCSRFQPGLLHELFRFGGVLLLDEIDLNTDGFLSELFPTLRERVLTLHDSAGETLVAHDQFIVFATMNGARGYRRRELDAAMKNRFTHIIDWRYDTEVERRLGVVESVAALADGIRKQVALEEISTPLPTNALLDFQSIAQSLGLDYAIGNFVARFARDEQQAIEIALSGMKANFKRDLGLQ